MKMDSSQDAFSLVTFLDIQEFYMIDSTINVKFTISAPLEPGISDSIGLFRIGWLSVQNYVGLAKVPLVQEDSTTEQSMVTFNVKDLTVEDGEFYQFCYLAENIHVRGVSIPFQFVIDDFEIVPDISSFEQQSEESFVHAQHEIDSSTILMKSNSADFDASQVSLLKQRIAELEEASSRAADEILTCRQENDKLLNQLQSVEEVNRLKNQQLQSDSESLMKELENKQQFLREFENRVQGLESQVETEREKYSVLEVSFNALRDAQKQLEARCIKLTRDKYQFETERSRLLNENVEMSCRIAELSSQPSFTSETVQEERPSSEALTVTLQPITSEHLPSSSGDKGEMTDEDMPVRTDDDVFPQQQLESSRADEPSAPSLEDMMDLGARQRDETPLIPVEQTVMYPYPYPIPRTWFPNPYASYVPQAYRIVQ